MKLLLPEGWHEVTIKQYLNARTIIKTITDPIEVNMRLVSALGNITYKHVEQMPLKSLMEAAKCLDFLKELPTKRLPLTFKLDGKKFTAKILQEDMTAGQFIDYSSVCNEIPKGDESIFHMHRLLACFCVEKEYKGYVKNAELFYEKMPMSIAYPFYVFFCNVAQRLPKAMSRYSRKLLLKNLRTMKKELSAMGKMTS